VRLFLFQKTHREIFLSHQETTTMNHPLLLLRDVIESDLAIFFVQQQDPEANHMAAFTVKDPSDREVFDKRWRRILRDSTIVTQSIIYNQEVAGSVSCYQSELGSEVTYWLGKEFWGKGIAPKALAMFLQAQPKRPCYARVATDNLASRRVLERCGFVVTAEECGFAEVCQADIAELILQLS
jgi:RimJ/RimL family protein N-acetyltransferase